MAAVLLIVIGIGVVAIMGGQQAAVVHATREYWRRAGAEDRQTMVRSGVATTALFIVIGVAFAVFGPRHAFLYFMVPILAVGATAGLVSYIGLIVWLVRRHHHRSG